MRASATKLEHGLRTFGLCALCMSCVCLAAAVGCGSKASNDTGTSSAGGTNAAAGTSAAGAGAGSTNNAGASGVTGNAGTTGQAGTNAGTSGPSMDAGQPTDPEHDASVDGGASVDSGPPSGTSMADGKLGLWITAQAIAEDHEDHICVTVELPNDQPVWVKSIHATLAPGSHHLIVDRVQNATSGTVPQSCAPTMGGDDTRLLIAQQPDTTLNLPSGTAFRLEAHQHVFLQLHYINYTGKTADIRGSVELELADTSAGTPIEALSLFTGSMNIYLPVGQQTTIESFFKPGSVAKPWHVFAITSHTHSLGIDSTIERVASQSAPTTTPLHESTQWAEPPLTTFDLPLIFNGSDGLRLRCKYDNTTNHPVTFGTRFEDEMCFLWLYYYQEP